MGQITATAGEPRGPRWGERRCSYGWGGRGGKKLKEGKRHGADRTAGGREATGSSGRPPPTAGPGDMSQGCTELTPLYPAGGGLKASREGPEHGGWRCPLWTRGKSTPVATEVRMVLRMPRARVRGGPDPSACHPASIVGKREPRLRWAQALRATRPPPGLGFPQACGLALGPPSDAPPRERKNPPKPQEQHRAAL